MTEDTASDYILKNINSFIIETADLVEYDLSESFYNSDNLAKDYIKENL